MDFLKVCRWNVYRRALIPRKLPCPKKILVTRLLPYIFKVSFSTLVTWVSKKSSIDQSEHEKLLLWGSKSNYHMIVFIVKFCFPEPVFRENTCYHENWNGTCLLWGSKSEGVKSYRSEFIYNIARYMNYFYLT